MTGVRYWRLRRRMSKKDLAAKSGISNTFIGVAEKTISPTTSLWCYIRLARVLDVTVSDICREYSVDQLRGCDRVPSKRTTCQAPTNCLDRYRKEANLSFDQLGKLLGVSRQFAHAICRKEIVSDQYVVRLAESLGMSTEEIRTQFTEKNEATNEI